MVFTKPYMLRQYYLLNWFEQTASKLQLSVVLGLRGLLTHPLTVSPWPVVAGSGGTFVYRFSLTFRMVRHQESGLIIDGTLTSFSPLTLHYSTMALLDSSWLNLLYSTIAVHHSTSLYLLDSSWLNLLYSTIALHHSTSLYLALLHSTLQCRFFTLLHSTMALLPSTCLYITLPWLYFTLLYNAASSFYFPLSTSLYNGCTALYLNLLLFTMALLPSTSRFYSLIGSMLESTCVHFTLATNAIFHSTQFCCTTTMK